MRKSGFLAGLVLMGAAAGALAQEKDAAAAVRYSLAFLDPPYPMIEDPLERAKVLAMVRTLFETALGPDGMVVLHVATRASETLRFGKGLQSEARTYGSSAIVYVERAPSGEVR